MRKRSPLEALLGTYTHMAITGGVMVAIGIVAGLLLRWLPGAIVAALLVGGTPALLIGLHLRARTKALIADSTPLPDA